MNLEESLAIIQLAEHLRKQCGYDYAVSQTIRFLIGQGFSKHYSEKITTQIATLFWRDGAQT